MDLSELNRLDQQLDPNHPAQILRRAKALIDRPEKWFGPRDHDYGYIDGKSVPANCSGTAILQATYGDTWHRLYVNWSEIPAMNILAQAMGQPNGNHVASWNNANGRTHAQVLAAFDRAIELAERG